MRRRGGARRQSARCGAHPRGQTRGTAKSWSAQSTCGMSARKWANERHWAQPGGNQPARPGAALMRVASQHAPPAHKAPQPVARPRATRRRAVGRSTWREIHSVNLKGVSPAWARSTSSPSPARISDADVVPPWRTTPSSNESRMSRPRSAAHNRHTTGGSTRPTSSPAIRPNAGRSNCPRRAPSTPARLSPTTRRSSPTSSGRRAG